MRWTVSQTSSSGSVSSACRSLVWIPFYFNTLHLTFFFLGGYYVQAEPSAMVTGLGIWND